MDMHPKLIEILEQIENRLLSNDITKFYIGITDDWERREQEHLRDGYTLGSTIATGNGDVIKQSEKELIAWVYSIFGIRIRHKCNNKPNTGGEGTETAYTLYVVAKRELPSHPLFRLPCWLTPRPTAMIPLLLEFEPINLQ